MEHALEFKILLLPPNHLAFRILPSYDTDLCPPIHTLFRNKVLLSGDF